MLSMALADELTDDILDALESVSSDYRSLWFFQRQKKKLVRAEIEKIIHEAHDLLLSLKGRPYGNDVLIRYAIMRASKYLELEHDYHSKVSVARIQTRFNFDRSRICRSDVQRLVAAN